MSSKQSPEQVERHLIGSRSHKRPYGAKVMFQVLTDDNLRSLEDMTLLLEAGTIATLTSTTSPPWEGCRTYRVALEGFPRASSAEAGGLRLAQTLLLLAVSLNFGLRLDYSAHDPATVYERFAPKGDTTTAYGAASWAQHVMLKSLSNALDCPDLPRPTLLSMELYCAAVLEGNARARFVGVVSALEPLAIQDSLGDRVADFVDESIGRLATVDVADDVRQSLAGRVRELKRESVRQALRRLCGQWFPGRRSAWDAIDRAYRLRSQLVHDGVLADADIDLGVETEKVGAIIRAIYEQSARHPFWVKPTLPD